MTFRKYTDKICVSFLGNKSTIWTNIYGSRESAPTNNRKFTSDKRKQPQGKWACGRAGARACGRAGARACGLAGTRARGRAGAR
jgi:hypothetical protein